MGSYVTNPDCPVCNGHAGELRHVAYGVSWSADFTGDRPGRRNVFETRTLHCHRCYVPDNEPLGATETSLAKQKRDEATACCWADLIEAHTEIRASKDAAAARPALIHSLYRFLQENT